MVTKLHFIKSASGTSVNTLSITDCFTSNFKTYQIVYNSSNTSTNTNLDVTASFSNVTKPNPKYTVSIHNENDDEITSYTLIEYEGETFSLNWKENSPGTKKYTVKLNGRTHSSDHDITIDGDDNNGIYKINKINFKWYNTNGVNESVEKWVIVVKKDGYAPLETKNIVKDGTDFFNNFTDFR